jgi:hypothetical protein
MALTPIVARDGNNAAQNMGALQDLAGINTAMVSLDSSRQTYRASASFTPLVTSALALVTIQGSATKTIRIKRIQFGGVATAIATTLMRLTRLSVIGTGGTAVAPTISKNDTASATPTAVVQHYTTAAQSTGTVVSALSTWRQNINVVTTPVLQAFEPQMVYPERGVIVGQSLVLRGVSDFIQIENFNAGSLGAASVFEYVIEWEEDNS